MWALATEAHHRPGNGMSADFYRMNQELESPDF
jgi:hypothetical protein